MDVDIHVSHNKIFWDNGKVPLFRHYLEQSLPNLLSSNDTNCTINEKVELFSTFLAKNSTKVFGKVMHKKNNDTKNGKIKTSQWFDAECKTAKKEFKKARNFYLKHKNDSNSHNFVRCGTKYKKIKCKAKKKQNF